jgi:hypothetical protein
MPDWLTYAQAGERFGITAEAARQIALRRKWPRRKPNDDPYGRVQVLVPEDADTHPRTVQRPSELAYERPLNTRPSRELDTLREAVDTLREQLERAENRADGAEKRVEAAEARERQGREAADARADAAERGRDAERARADALADRVHVVQVELAKAEAEGDALTIETAELTAQVKAAKAEAREAQDRAEELRQAEATRRGRGRLARLRAAWQGE